MAQVDIVIPLYNKASTIGRTIRSVLHQTITDWHLIVVDDGSTDGGAEVVRSFADNRIEIISQENKGPGAARNVGIARANSKYVSFIDADDEWYPWFLENSLNAIEQNNVTLVCSMYYLWPEQVDMTDFWAKRGVKPGIYEINKGDDPVWINKFKGMFLAWNILMRTDIARRYDGFYEKNKCVAGEDVTFFLRVIFGQKVMVIEPASVRRHTEDGLLGIYNLPFRPVPPYLIEPDEILRYCPEHKRELMQKMLDFMAVGAARRFARSGDKRTAMDLLNRFEGTRGYASQYWRCRYEITLSWLFPCWIKFKCVVVWPIKVISRKFNSLKLKSEPPAMPYE